MFTLIKNFVEFVSNKRLPELKLVDLVLYSLCYFSSENFPPNPFIPAISVTTNSRVCDFAGNHIRESFDRKHYCLKLKISKQSILARINA